ncbi:hypothetical protein FGO68_gene3233 [Halteria grandinella]|uniref:Protein phosphatase n=1 Tax=Halteria grandinella TaxID=5974 RepID=A0A8J8ND22_HALGN|nr:hypothetical protein FGO68_gene3233 [Halteria grandinella]
MIPHFEKRYKGGEDAYIERPDLLVVADGVGGWGEVGVDPGLFSKALVKLIEEEYVKNPVQGKLKEYLVEAVKKNKNVGSSTCVLAKFGGVQDGQVVMETTNLGDSGYMIIRAPEVGSKNQEPLEVIFRSKEQQYRFNFPYQCGTDCELPYAAEDKQHQMRSNDIVIMASDGLFDNLYHEDVLSCLKPHYRPSAQSRAATGEVTNLFGAADCMARKAEKLGLDQGYMSPFARGAQQVGIPYRGGKADDVTVIVAQVNFKYQ